MLTTNSNKEVIPFIRHDFGPYYEELQSNVNVFQDITEVIYGVKACESLCMDNVCIVLCKFCHICLCLFNVGVNIC